MPNAEPFCREVLPHLPALRSAARRFAGLRSDLADDLVQETFLRALSSSSRYQPGSNAGAWLYVILGNTARTAFRRERRELRLRERYALEPGAGSLAPPFEALAAARLDVAPPSSPAGEVPPPAPPAAAMLSPRLRELFTELPPPFRTVVQCVDIEGLSYQQAAERIGCPIGTVMSRLHRARRRLRRKLDGSASPAGRLQASGPVGQRRAATRVVAPSPRR